MSSRVTPGSIDEQGRGKDRAWMRSSIVKSKVRSGSDGRNSTKDKLILKADVYENAFDKSENAIIIRESAGSRGWAEGGMNRDDD